MSNSKEITCELYNSSGAAITGATVTIKLRRTPEGTAFDWNDNTLKASAWTTLANTMTEVDATNFAGLYKQTIDISLLPNGQYVASMSYSATKSQHGSVSFSVSSGLLLEEPSGIPTAVWAATLPL